MNCLCFGLFLERDFFGVRFGISDKDRDLFIALVLLGHLLLSQYTVEAPRMCRHDLKFRTTSACQYSCFWHFDCIVIFAGNCSNSHYFFRNTVRVTSYT